MLRIRYDTDPDFCAILHFVGNLDEELAAIDPLLSDERLLKLIEADLSRRYPHTTQTGRNSTPVEVIVRMLVLKHLRSISYSKTIKQVNESIVLRQFCRVYFNPLPNKSTLLRWANLITVETLKQFNQLLTAYATQLQITQGKRMRTDGTVVETNIHFPSDNNLLVDGLRVLTRLLQQARKLLLDHNCSAKAQLFRNRHRTARRISRRIDSLSRTHTQRGSEQRKKAYEKLLEVSKASLKQAQGVQKLLQNIKRLSTEKLNKAFQLFLPRVVQVLDQTYRRVFQLQKVPSPEKIVSLFESHTDIICRGKTNVLVEFGHKVWLDEVDGGIISNYRVLYGNPHDTQQWCESLTQHQQQFSHSPQQASADRGVFSQPNENFASELGVEHIILPKSGYKSQQRQQHEKQRYFRQGRYWHNGVEGRISYLKRSFGFNRCLYRGDLGFERWVALGIIAHNLTIISRNLV